MKLRSCAVSLLVLAIAAIATMFWFWREPVDATTDAGERPRATTPGPPPARPSGTSTAPESVSATPLPGPATPASLPTCAVLRGQVITPGGDGIPGTSLALLASHQGGLVLQSDLLESFPSLFQDEVVVDSAVSAADGSFAFRNVAPGWYVIAARKAGLQVRFTPAVQATRGSPPPPIEIVLRAGRTLQGRVHSEAGNPVVGAAIAAVDYVPGAHWNFHAQRTTTDARGEFRLTTLGDARVALFVRAQGFAPLARWDAPLDGGDLDLVLEPAARITGRVVDAQTSEPLSGARVAVLETSEYAVLGTTQTDAAGRYTFDSAPTGKDVGLIARLPGFAMAACAQQSYEPRGDPLGAIVLPNVAPGSAVTADISLMRGGTIRGRVIEAVSDLPIGGAAVAARFSGSLPFLPWADPAETTTANDGTFTLGPLGAGMIIVTARAAGFVDLALATPPGNGDSAARVALRPGSEAAPVVIRLARGADLEVRVVDPQGVPRAGATVTCAAPSEQFALLRGIRGAAEPQTTGTDGVAHLRGVPPAKNLIVGARHADFPAGGHLVVDATLRATPTLTITLRNSCTLSGIVLRPDGNPAADAGLEFAATDTTVRLLFGDVQQPLDLARTDAAGRFRFHGLVPGPGTLQLLATGPSSFRGPAYRLDPRAAVVELTAEAAAERELRIVPAEGR